MISNKFVFVIQKTHEEIAEEKRLHLVELIPENFYYPTVLASPSVCKKEEEIDKDEIIDFKQYCFDGKVVYKWKKYPPFYTKHKSWEIYLKKQEKLRNQDNVRTQMLVQHGELRSFLTDKYPEAKPYKRPPKTDAEEEATE